MNNNCPQCIALWRDYADITRTHFALESKLQLAGLEHDHALVKQLLAEAHAASERRSELHLQIQEHEHAAHSDQDVLGAEL